MWVRIHIGLYFSSDIAAYGHCFTAFWLCLPPPRPPPSPHEGGRRRDRQRKICWMDYVETDSPAHTRTVHADLPQKRVEENLCWMSEKVFSKFLVLLWYNDHTVKNKHTIDPFMRVCACARLCFSLIHLSVPSLNVILSIYSFYSSKKSYLIPFCVHVLKQASDFVLFL